MIIKKNIKNNIKPKNIAFMKHKDNSESKRINKKLFKNNLQEVNPMKKTKKIIKYVDDEINEFSYNLALQFDKRTFCDYYISLLKTKHNLIFALCNNNDYNSGIIKIDLFFIGFAIEYVVNALFYNDDTMHKIYESKGKFDLEAQLPIIAYSYLISTILNTPLNYLALSNDLIITFKQDHSKINIMKRKNKLIRILIIKFIFYFIISFLFLLFFLYYISLFGVIYKNTQIHLLKDTLMSLGLSFVVPFIIYSVLGIFRIPSLYNRKRKCLYNLSKILQSF